MRNSSRLLFIGMAFLFSTSAMFPCVVEVLGRLKLETVEGVVYQAYQDVPVEGAVVEIWETTAGTYQEYAEGGSTLSLKRVSRTTTNKEGRFKFEGVTPRSYEIVFRSEEYGTRKAYLEVYRPGSLRKKRAQEAVAVLSRRGPCGSVSQRDRK